MKKILFIILFTFAFLGRGFAQRYAVIDSKYILEQITGIYGRAAKIRSVQ